MRPHPLLSHLTVSPSVWALGGNKLGLELRTPWAQGHNTHKMHFNINVRVPKGNLFLLVPPLDANATWDGQDPHIFDQ
jgi:hypothetical protein